MLVQRRAQSDGSARDEAQSANQYYASIANYKRSWIDHMIAGRTLRSSIRQLSPQAF